MSPIHVIHVTGGPIDGRTDNFEYSGNTAFCTACVQCGNYSRRRRNKSSSF